MKPSSAPWDGRRVPFTLLGGYLGAGKTTIVNHLVAHAAGRRLVVLVNDVGAVAVDAAMIADHDGVTMSLTNGCVCCSIADDLGRTLETVRQLPEPPDHLVLELSGVAEPARAASWAHTAGFRLDGIVVAVDAERIAEQLDRREIGDTVAAQLAAADLLVLTKTDLVADAPAARQRVEEHTAAPIVVATDGAVDPDVVLGLDRRADAGVGRSVLEPSDAGYRLSVLDLGDVDRVELQRVLDDLGDDVVRAKGLIRCRDVLHPLEVNVVGTRRRLRERPDLPSSAGDQRLVVIAL